MYTSRRLQVWSGPLLVVVTVAACGWFAGRLVSHVGEAAAFDERRHGPEPEAPARPVREAAPPPAPVGDGGALVTRNMFCSGCQTTAAPGPRPAGGGSHAVPRLIATQVGRDEAWATIDDPVAGVSGLFARGATLPGGGVIEAIERAAMIVRFPDNTTERVALATSAGAAKPPVARVEKESPYADRVRVVGDNRWEVDRTLIRELVQSGTGQRTAAKGVALRPVGKDGKLAGVRVVAARPGSLGAILGLQSGDVIETVDGKPLDSTERLMDLYGRLDDTRRVDLGIKRKGADQTLIYDLP